MKKTGIIILVIIFIILGANFIRSKSLTFDEPNHIIRGYIPLVSGNFKLSWAHPPLINLFSGLPLRLLSLKTPKEAISDEYVEIFEIAKKFIDLNKDKVEQITVLSRFPILILSVILMIFVFKSADELFGYRAGIVASILYAFNPAILGSSGQALTDLGVSLFIFLAVYSLRKYLKHPTRLNILKLGFMSGLALVSKFSAVLLMPIIFIVSMVHYLVNKVPIRSSILKVLKILIVVACASALVIILVHGFKVYTAHYSVGGSEEKEISLICKPYIHGLIYAYKLPSTGRSGFLFGKHGRHWWYGYIVAFLVKTPIPLIVIMLLSFVYSRDRECNTFFLLPALIYFIMVSFISMPVHHKYILPIYPLLCVFSSSIVASEMFSKKIPKVLLYILLIWYVLGTIGISPHYLSYFNELAGGPDRGHEILVDSNIDHGQDLKTLKKYLDDKEIREINFAYFGTTDPAHYGIKYKKMKPFVPTSGWVAISITHLKGVHTKREGYAWLKDHVPVDKVGYSIHVYKIQKRRNKAE
ncbi:ArnT family glycosyltransferase [Candidatus Omnitrophota bacterium]